MARSGPGESVILLQYRTCVWHGDLISVLRAILMSSAALRLGSYSMLRGWTNALGWATVDWDSQRQR
jgi:hypothetical protein